MVVGILKRIRTGYGGYPKSQVSGDITNQITTHKAESDPHNLDDLTDGTSFKKMTSAERTTIAGVEVGADVTGDHQADVDIDNITDGTTYKKLLATERTKLTGIEAGADVTANQLGPLEQTTAEQAMKIIFLEADATITPESYDGANADTMSVAAGHDGTIDTANTTAVYNSSNKEYQTGPDYTDFTEVDPATFISVDSATQITWTGIDRNTEAYVYKATSPSVTGDFTVQGSFKCTTCVSNAAVFIFGYAGEIDDFNNTVESAGIRMNGNGSDIPALIIEKRESSTPGTSSASPNLAINTRYWWTFARIGTTLYLDIYSDSTRTTQVGSQITLGITAAATYTYAYGISSWNNGQTSFTSSGIIYEIEDIIFVSGGAGIVQTLNLTPDLTSNITKVYVAIYGDGAATVTVKVSADNGTTWTTSQNLETWITSGFGTGDDLKLQFELDGVETLKTYVDLERV